MQIVTLHNTDTEEIMGSVYPVKSINFDKFLDGIRNSFIAFHKWSKFEEDYTIEDFVDYHNNNSDMKIDWVVSDFIQL